MTLPTALSKRTRRSTMVTASRRARDRLHAVMARTAVYRNGLQAERDSSRYLRTTVKQEARQEAREAWCRRTGRRIDLPSLLRQRRPDGTPRWTIVDPVVSLRGCSNGKFDTDGQIMIGHRWVGFPELGTEGPHRAFRPNGIPPLPAAARKLATDPRIRRRAAWVGLLFEPESWTEVRPDPAIVVEWQDLPGEYYALCVWGGDFRRIMEFVD